MKSFDLIQSKWVGIAEEFDQRCFGYSSEEVLQEMLDEKTDDFIKLYFDSKNSKLTEYQFKSDKPGEPDKILHDKLFRLANALMRIKPTAKVNGVLLKNLLDNSLLKCFPL